MENVLNELAQQRILTVAHRGASGGNIPCNTMAAYEIALRQGADMIEIDVEMSADGKLFILHPTMEAVHLWNAERLPNMTAEEISHLRYVNYDRTPTQFGVATLDEVLEQFGHRCLINVDKFWGHPQEIYETIRRHGLTDRVVVKSVPSEKVLSVLEEVAPDVPFMPIVKETHPLHEDLMKRNIRYIGAEVLFGKDTAEVASEAFIEKMHSDGKLVWVNAIIYNYRHQLSGGHSDDSSLCGDPADGWGWLAKRGFDLIQTDWPMMMRTYLASAGLLEH